MPKLFESFLKVASSLLQTKTVTASTTDITVTPDSGYSGISELTIDPTPSETKTASASITSQTTITPTSGKLMSSVTIPKQNHTGYSPNASGWHSANGGGLDIIDLGEFHNIEAVRLKNTASSTTYNAIGTVLLNTVWDVKNLNTRSVGHTVDNLSTDSTLPNYVLFVYGRNNTSWTEPTISVNNGSLDQISFMDDSQTFSGTSGCGVVIRFYKWFVTSSRATITVDRGASNYCSTFALSVYKS